MRGTSWLAGIAATGLLLSAGVSGAASISLTATDDDGGLLEVGDAITLTVDAVIGDGEPAPVQVIVAVRWDGDGSVDEHGASDIENFTQFDGGAPATVGGVMGQCEWALDRTDQCNAWDVLFQVAGSPVDPGTYTSTLHYTALTAGVVDFSFQDAVGSDFDFFDLGSGTDVGTAPAGTSVTIVPEPTTAALLGLGLFGLALGGRRR